MAIKVARTIKNPPLIQVCPGQSVHSFLMTTKSGNSRPLDNFYLKEFSLGVGRQPVGMQDLFGILHLSYLTKKLELKHL